MTEGTCTKCGARLSGAALGGLCPKCVACAAFAPAANTPPSRADHAGDLRRVRYFGDYELIEEIARGGMGVVYAARQVSLNRIVALKMILSGALASEDDVQRFRAEAEAAANLRHPNIVSIYEIGEHQGRHYFSMEYIEGKNLSEVVREKPMPPRRAAEYAKVIAEAVQYAHEQGTLHRDLKPQNVLIDDRDEPHVTDFGLAKQFGAGSELTLSGQALGTPSFMSPEQAAGRRKDVAVASDIYSLGAILYHLLTGRPPFAAETLEETLRQVMESEPAAPRLLNSNTPRDLETICLKCLAKETQRRYSSAQDLADDLNRFLKGETIHARPVTRIEKVWRWCRREPALASLTLGIALLATIFMVTIFLSERRAQNTLEALRKTAPAFHAEARSLVDQRRFPEALEKISYALSLRPDEAEYHALKGNIYQSLLQFREACEEYQAALKAAPNHQHASKNLRLSEKMLTAATATTNLPAAGLEALRVAMLDEGRIAEAMGIAARLGQRNREILNSCQAQLDQAGLKGTFSWSNRGNLNLSLAKTPVSDLSPLRGMPLTYLDLRETKVIDLTPLHGMPLHALTINQTPVSNLSPLRGMALTHLNMSGCKVRDLTPLKGMSLESLALGPAPVSDLSALRGMPLKTVSIDTTDVTDLSPLADSPISNLEVTSCPNVADIRPLAGLPLHTLSLHGSNVRDLSPLGGVRVARLVLSETPVTDITPLKGSRNLLLLDLRRTRISDLSPLRGAPLMDLGLDSCTNLLDLTPLTDCPTLESLIIPRSVTNIGFLRQMPNLKRLSYHRENGILIVTSAEDFWAAYDARKTPAQ